MTKTKKQLRAEAVERLKDAQTDNLDWMLLGDECPNWVNYDTLSYEKAVRERVADLLTDDDANDDLAPENGVSDPDGGSNVAYIAPDSREKLEADVRKIAEAYNMDTHRHGTERFAHELYYSIIHLLNRQRAIDDSICDECSSDYYEMQEEHDQMIDGIAKLMRLKQPYTFNHDEPLENIETIGRYIDELTAELEKATNNLNSANKDFENARAELTAERDELKTELIDERGELNRQINTMRDVIREFRNERDNYRSKFGKCLDYADAIHALMDDEGMA